MPEGKELEQLPMANTLPGMGDDESKFSREKLVSLPSKDIPRPAEKGQSRNQ
ncbi:hypothetical protein [Bacillus massilinigeriensis]|uniref:hypothetical protein n=1 Tax=Bacillus mediterraneensis TaxID=1805474 RepID=UPI00190EDCB5|nr:hypothetical protein [Bacillus mediterraneensis]